MNQPNGQLKVPWDNARLLVVPGSIASQLENLGGQVLHDSCHVNWSPCTHPLGIVPFPIVSEVKTGQRCIKARNQPEKPVDPANRELEACPAGPRLCLSLHLATLSTARHLAYELKF